MRNAAADARETTALAHRGKNFPLMVSSFSPDPGVGALRQLAPGMYGNFVGLTEQGREQARPRPRERPSPAT